MMNANEIRQNGGARASADIDDSTILCACNNFTLGDMTGLLASRSNITFDEFLEETGAGNRCTACLLDVEHYFVNRVRSTAPSKRASAKQEIADKLSVKQRIYQFVDKLSPKSPIRLADHVPVLAGAGVNQWFRMANHSLFYEDQICAPSFNVELILRNAAGNSVWKQKFDLKQGSSIRENVSARLIESGTPNLPDALSIGWLEIVRRANENGVRGTTRSQLEIVSRAGSCSVHGQAAGLIQGGQMALLAQPDTDRIFISAANVQNKPLAIEYCFPILVNSPQCRETSTVSEPRKKIVCVPPRGAALTEFSLTHEECEQLEGRLFTIRWKAAGTYKSHFIVASKELSRFSIDHV